jgi:leucyl aminopeptidase
VKVEVVEGPLETVKADAIVVGVYAEEGRLRESAARIDKALGGQLAEILEAERFSGKPAHVTHMHTGGRIPAGRVVVVGLGKRVELTLETIRRAASAPRCLATGCP